MILDLLGIYDFNKYAGTVNWYDQNGELTPVGARALEEMFRRNRRRMKNLDIEGDKGSTKPEAEDVSVSSLVIPESEKKVRELSEYEYNSSKSKINKLKQLSSNDSKPFSLLDRLKNPAIIGSLAGLMAPVSARYRLLSGLVGGALGNQLSGSGYNVSDYFKGLS